MTAFAPTLDGAAHLRAVELTDPASQPPLGWKLRALPVELLRAGDFTMFTGYRRVTAVEAVTETRGRGSKKATRTVGYRVFRSDGTHDDVSPGRTLTVFAP